MSLGITNAYIGHFSGFQFKPSADVQPNTIVAEGQLLGVTRQKFVAGSTGLAFMGMPAEVWNFALATAANTAISRGVEVYMDSSGKISFSAGVDKSAIGVLWSPVASGDTQADIMLYPTTPSPALAANQADSTATDVTSLVADFNALLAKLKAAGLMANSDE